jgi:hypothetical protein
VELELKADTSSLVSSAGDTLGSIPAAAASLTLSNPIRSYPMATELLPVVDLRVLSQPDLDALAAASAHALAPRTCPDADPLPPLKIDRAVFNESAGSRKQTFSRRRLAASPSSARHSSSAQTSTGRKNDPEGDLVAYHLRRLFVPDDPSLPPPPEPQTLALLQEPSPPPPPAPDPDRETTNAKGVSVDLLGLAAMPEPYDAELHRRTAGMASGTDLQGFIDSLAGEWVSQKKRRKNVDASFFGDHLPRGWKLQLGLKRNSGSIWVRCFSYVRFASFALPCHSFFINDYMLVVVSGMELCCDTLPDAMYTCSEMLW